MNFLVDLSYQLISLFLICLGPVSRDQNWDLFEKLRESNEKQREQLRVREKEFQDKLGETESVMVFNFLTCSSIQSLTTEFVQLAASESVGTPDRIKQGIT